jgi:hypothetical protein
MFGAMMRREMEKKVAVDQAQLALSQKEVRDFPRSPSRMKGRALTALHRSAHGGRGKRGSQPAKDT